MSDQADGYYFTMPATWYVEKNGSSDVAVYPDYDPAPGIKIYSKQRIAARR